MHVTTTHKLTQWRLNSDYEETEGRHRVLSHIKDKKFKDGEKKHSPFCLYGLLGKALNCLDQHGTLQY